MSNTSGNPRRSAASRLTSEELETWRGFIGLNAVVRTRLGQCLHDDVGLTNPEYVVLATLTEARGDPVRATALAGTMEWDRSRLSHQLRRMEVKGLIARCPAQEDGRGSLIAYTPKGKEAFLRAAPGHLSRVRKVFLDAFTDEEITTLRGLLETGLKHARSVELDTPAK